MQQLELKGAAGNFQYRNKVIACDTFKSFPVAVCAGKIK